MKKILSYGGGIGSACWFCPFAKKEEIENLKKNYPNLYKKLVDLHKNCQRKDLARKFI